MAWYDYIPVAGSVGRLAQGDYKHALQDQLSAGSLTGEGSRKVENWIGDGGLENSIGKMDFMGWNEKRQGYQDARNMTNQLGDKLRDFQMQGLDRAEGYFGPAQAMNKAVYGDPSRMRK